MKTTFVDIEEPKVDPIPRHKGNGRPKIFPEDGGKGTFYARMSSFGEILEDTTNLSKWQQRKVLQGVKMAPGLLDDVLLDEDWEDDSAFKQKVNKLCDKLKKIAHSDLKADIGTALHKITEEIDKGNDPGFIHPDYERSVEAYVKATECLEVLDIETFVVLDEYQVAGTFDRLVLDKRDGRVKIADLKTGRTDYGQGKMAIQFSGYAHSRRYDPYTYRRSPIHPDIDLSEAITIALPEKDSGKCELIPVDIAVAWQGLEIVSRAREWRRLSKKLMKEPSVSVQL